MGDAEIVIGFINGYVAVGGLSLKTNTGTRQILGLPGIINVALKQARRRHVGRGGAARNVRHQGLNMAEGVPRAALLLKENHDRQYDVRCRAESHNGDKLLAYHAP